MSRVKPLYAAAKKGDVERVVDLIQQGKDLNVKCERFERTPLMIAINKIDGTNDCQKVAKKLIEAKAEVDLKDKNGLTALMYAACIGDLEIVKMLCDRGANPDLQNKKGWTAAMFAAQMRHEEVLEYFNSKTYNRDLKNQVGLTVVDIILKQALFKAAREDNLNNVKIYLNYNIDINATDHKTGKTALHYAAESGSDKVVEYLLEQKNIDLSKKDYNKKTALSYASENNCMDCIKRIIDALDKNSGIFDKGNNALEIKEPPSKRHRTKTKRGPNREGSSSRSEGPSI